MAPRVRIELTLIGLESIGLPLAERDIKMAHAVGNDPTSQDFQSCANPS